MLQKLKDIPRLLSVVQHYTEKNGAVQNFVLSEFSNSGVLEGTKQNFKEALEFCLVTNILEKHEDNLLMTDLGWKIFEQYNKDYELNEIQKDIISKECLLTGQFAKRVLPMFQYFRRQTIRKTLYYKKNKLSDIGDAEILPLLYQSSILIKEDGIVILNPKYVPYITISSSLDSKRKITLEELRRSLEVKDEVGDIAEEIVLEFERKRLIQLGLKGEAANVQRISVFDVGAGYDIVSYDSEGDAFMKHDRFIEVKGSTNTELSFFWSRNEIEIAKELGARYWIYFLGGIDRKTRNSTEKPLGIQNPSTTILDDESFKKEYTQIRVYKSNDSE